jgi:hypothetical protein
MANSKFIFLRMLDFLDLIDLAPVPGEVSHGREVKSEEVKSSGTRNFNVRLTNSGPKSKIQH